VKALRHLWLAALALPILFACASKKDVVEPPAKLTNVEQTLDVRKLWSSKVGKGTKRLRLALRPASDGAHVFAGGHNGEVAAFDAETGRKQWSVKTDLELSAGPAFGDGVLVFGTSDGELVALDASSGEQRWMQTVGSEVIAAPVIASGVVVLRTVDGRLRGFATSNGNTLWSVTQSHPALTLRGNTSPRVSGAVVVSGFANGRVGAYDLRSGDAAWEVAIANPTGRSELERLVDVGSGLQVVGNDVYVVGYHGRAVGIDLQTGTVLWQQDMSSYAGLTADFGNVYVTNEVDAIVALDRTGGAQVWRQEALRLRDLTAPTRYANTLVVGDFEGYLHWLDPADGKFIAREHAAGARISTAPLVVGRNVYAQGDDGTVAAYTVRDGAA
jgi:outer membrane protein assembly factor BamB